jgi:hypothetical protein
MTHFLAAIKEDLHALKAGLKALLEARMVAMQAANLRTTVAVLQYYQHEFVLCLFLVDLTVRSTATNNSMLNSPNSPPWGLFSHFMGDGRYLGQ